MLTVLVPTKNRPSFLTRLCSYYRERNLDHQLLIVDSSEPEQASENRRALELLEAGFKVEYKLYENEIGFLEKLNEALASVETPYAVLGADDDLFVPDGLTRAVEFLEANQDYALAHGDALTFSLNTNEAWGKLENVWRYEQRTVDDESGVERLVNHFVNYSATWYSVHRTKQLRENLLAAKQVVDLLFVEMLPSGLSLIQGKAKKLGGLYMVRQSDTAKEYNTFDPFDWITNLNWASQYESFRNCLAEAVVLQDKIELEKARADIKRAFWSYLGKHLGLRWQSNYGHLNTGSQSALRQMAGGIPGARRLRATLRRLKKQQGNEISLQGLLNVSSPFHEDFMPIYRVLTTPLAIGSNPTPY
jgi:glycosyltransferase domain-containing protein